MTVNRIGMYEDNKLCHKDNFISFDNAENYYLTWKSLLDRRSMRARTIWFLQLLQLFYFLYRIATYINAVPVHSNRMEIFTMSRFTLVVAKEYNNNNACSSLKRRRENSFENSGLSVHWPYCIQHITLCTKVYFKSIQSVKH